MNEGEVQRLVSQLRQLRLLWNPMSERAERESFERLCDGENVRKAALALVEEDLRETGYSKVKPGVWARRLRFRDVLRRFFRTFG